MSETTQEERDSIRGGKCDYWIPVSLSPDVARRLANDADRLAELEQGVRELTGEDWLT